MPSVELFNSAADPDGWHDVRSPGGYEWWYFDAEDAATDTQIVAIFMQGFIFHPGYLRRYERFRRSPTKHLPPVAGDFPCAYFCIYRRGKTWKQFFTQYAPGTLQAAIDRCDVTIGENRLRADDGRSYEIQMDGIPWHLSARGPVREKNVVLRGMFRFVDNASSSSAQSRPTTPERRSFVAQAPLDDVIAQPHARAFLSREMTGADHRWSVIAPRCSVGGVITCGDETIQFAGTGYHDHNYGTAPIGDGLARWTWGRAFFGEERVVTFHYPEPRLEPGRPRPHPKRTADGPARIPKGPEVHLVEARGDRVCDLPVERVVADWSLVCNPAMRLKYPRTLDFGPALRLSNPRVIDPSPFYLRLQFEAESFGEHSTAFCEIAYPHRLRWPLLGRMIEMSFDKRRGERV